MPHNGENQKCFKCQKPITPNSYIQVGLHLFHSKCYKEWVESESNQTRLRLQEIDHE